ncbi:terminase large subunit domain-containing protein [Thalassospira marina]|uniref:Phage portal protein n=1 Tax=Thalassospira marina TaxID=2048283 RepID=A0ABM6QBL4_9PROT|nr:terminase family protein [Thalassospira marina]AUG53929.1 hypothetical protein CSC3H3_15290 [Thalassospira marina]
MEQAEINPTPLDFNPSQFDADEVLLKYQRDWIADTSDIKLAEKSRRTGLTWAEAADAVLTAGASKSAGGGNHFYVGSNREMAVEFIDACAMWARAFDQAAGEIEEEILKDGDKDILTFNIRFSSGFKIQALSSRPSNLRGRQGNVTIDEAAFHDHLDEVLKAAMALTMWGSKIRIISTHNGVEHLFNELIEDTRAGKKPYSIHRITLDDACAQGLYQRICQIRGIEWSEQAEKAWKEKLLAGTASKEDALEEYYCVPKSGGGAYLSRSLIEARMYDAPVIRFECDDAFRKLNDQQRKEEIDAFCEIQMAPLLKLLDRTDEHAFGEDFGRSADLTVIAPMAIKPNLKRVVPFLVELRNIPFRSQEQILFYIVDRLPRLRAGRLDARGNGQYLAERAVDRYGASIIEAVMISQSWYLDVMPKFKARFEDDLIAIPRDRDVVDDLRALQVIKGIPKIPDGKTGEDQNRHGDAAIALAMADNAADGENAPIEFTAAAKAGPFGRSLDIDDDDDGFDLGFGASGGW